MNHEHDKKMNKLKEDSPLKEALSQLTQITGIKVKVSAVEVIRTGYTIDAVLEFGSDKKKHILFAEVKHELRQANIPPLIAKISKQKECWLLVAKYIPQPIKDQLKTQSINYLEATGNCFINFADLFVYINARPVTAIRQTATGKLWKEAGLKFLFAVISNPALLNAPYRTIADAAGIALGNIGALLKELQEGGYAKKNADSWVLVNKEAVIQRWVELFHVSLKPKLNKGRFKFLDQSMRHNWKTIQKGNFFWGGEPAGELFTNFLEPELFTIYSNAAVTELMKELKLVPAATGEIELVKQFWNNEVLNNNNSNISQAVPPLLAYADLIEVNDSRNWDVAARIKNKYLND